MFDHNNIIEKHKDLHTHTNYYIECLIIILIINKTKKYMKLYHVPQYYYLWPPSTLKKHAWILCSHHLEHIMRKMISAAITTGNTNNNRYPGGETGPMKNGPKTSIATMIKNATRDPIPHTSGCFIFPTQKMQINPRLIYM